MHGVGAMPCIARIRKTACPRTNAKVNASAQIVGRISIANTPRQTMFERFTEGAIKTIMLAQEESRRLGHNFVGTEQILLGLIGEGKGTAAKVLRLLGVGLKETREEVQKIIGRGSGFVAVEIPFTPRSKRVLELAWEEARRLACNFIDTEHLLLGLLRERTGVAAFVLENLNVDQQLLRTRIIDALIEKGTVKDADRNELLTSLDVPQSYADSTPVTLSRRNCPSCAEDISATAIFCRHCDEGLSDEVFAKCPFCAESIRKEATRCRWCQSTIRH